MIKSLVLAAVTAAGALGAPSANAGVSWSIQLNTPVVGTVISGAPGYYERGYYEPGYYEPGYYESGYSQGYGRVYAPAPVYVPAPVYRVPPVAYYPPRVVYQPVPVGYSRYYPNRHPNYRTGRVNDHGRWDGHGRR